MAKQVHFIATKQDLIASLSSAESVCNVKYIDYWFSDVPNPAELPSLVNWEMLGVSINPRDAGKFLVLDSAASVITKAVNFVDGSVKYVVEQEYNPESLLLFLSGIYKVNQSIQMTVGKIATSLSDPKSAVFYKTFKKYFLKGYVNSGKNYWIGKEAAEMVARGVELIW